MKKTVLYLGGGVMSGVFGAGILTALQEANTYDKIEAIYSSSAGAFNAAYFLARQSALGSRIYWEDLIKDFIHPWKIISGTAQRFWNRYISPVRNERFHNVIDIDYLMAVVQNKKQLDIEEIGKQKIPFFIKVLDIKTGEVIYLDGKQNTIKTLKATANAVPYYAANGLEYIDGEIAKDPIGLDFLLYKHPDCKIIVVVNYTADQGIKHQIKNSLEGIVAGTMYDNIPLFQFFHTKLKRFRKDIGEARRNKRVLLITPPHNNPTRPCTTNSEKLKTTYEMGRKEAEKIVVWLT